jgi:hypothetical protein
MEGTYYASLWLGPFDGKRICVGNRQARIMVAGRPEPLTLYSYQVRLPDPESYTLVAEGGQELLYYFGTTEGFVRAWRLELRQLGDGLATRNLVLEELNYRAKMVIDRMTALPAPWRWGIHKQEFADHPGYVKRHVWVIRPTVGGEVNCG